MRTKRYCVSISDSGEIMVVQGRINNLVEVVCSSEKGVELVALMDDTKPLVEYGITAWPHGKKGIGKTSNWTFINTCKDRHNQVWDYYASQPVNVYTRNEIEDLFKKVMEPMLTDEMMEKFMDVLQEDTGEDWDHEKE